MSKATAIMKIALQRVIAHRFSVFAYRIGEIAELLFLIIMWQALYRHTNIISGYTLPELLSYILIGNLITHLTRNFLTDRVAQEINNGTLSLFMIKPMSYFRYVCNREMGRVAFPFFVSLVSELAIMAFFWQILIIQTNLTVLLVLIVMVLLAFITELFIAFLVALMAFWTDEVDGVHATVDRAKKFLSGSYFPLSILPPLYVSVSMLLPFAYSFYMPTQLYLGKLSTSLALRGIGIQCVWITLLYLIIKFIWYKGIRHYEGVGI